MGGGPISLQSTSFYPGPSRTPKPSSWNHIVRVPFTGLGSNHERIIKETLFPQKLSSHFNKLNRPCSLLVPILPRVRISRGVCGNTGNCCLAFLIWVEMRVQGSAWTAPYREYTA
jgi:hypothetical protein